MGIRAVDTWLALLVAFFEDAAAYDWGALALFYSSALLLSWALAAAVESARLDAARARLVRYFSALAPIAMFLGPGVFVPIGWVAPYLTIPGNTVSLT